jgi:hypothetical protein
MRSAYLKHLLTDPRFAPCHEKRLMGAFLWSTCVCVGLISACQRPELSGVAALDCEDGDKVIATSRVFCVFNVEALQAQAGTESGTDAGTESGTDAGTDAGTEAGAGAGTEAGAGAGTNISQDSLCPALLPHEYTLGALIICAREEGLPSEVIEAAAATWSEGEAQVIEAGAEAGVSAGAEAGVGVVAGAEVMLGGSEGGVEPPPPTPEPDPEPNPAP